MGQDRPAKKFSLQNHPVYIHIIDCYYTLYFSRRQEFVSKYFIHSIPAFVYTRLKQSKRKDLKKKVPHVLVGHPVEQR